MPVAYCSGREPCDRLISISAVPGGDPAARAQPDVYAVVWALCSCGSYTCDSCLGKQQGRCQCGLPVRLLSDAERVQIARGGPLPTTGGSVAPSRPIAPRVVAGPGGPTPIGPMLEGVEQQIENDLAAGNHERVRAMCGLAATLMATQGQNAPADELPWLVGFGENFYRWRCFYEGQQYWAGLYELMKKHRRDASEEGAVALASSLAFQVMAGDVTATSPNASAVLACVVKTFGQGHMLSREVRSRLGSQPVPTKPSPLPPAPAPAFAHPPVSMPASAPPRLPPPPLPQSSAAPKARPPAASTIMLTELPPSPPVAPSVANYDESTRLALWVTLAFLDVASADGRVGDDEYRAFRSSLAKMGLPDLWGRFGQQNLYGMLQDGLLYDLSTEFAWLPLKERNRLASLLVEFMMADGRAEPRELESVKRIAKWLDVKIAFR
jgi:uncharacterized tellurite resistance protein B-like protein